MSFQYEEDKDNYPQNNTPVKRKTNWIPWLLTAIMGLMLITNYFEGSASMGNTLKGFSWASLLILVCPLMMVFMMLGHGRSHQDNDKNQSANTEHGGCCGGNKK